MENRAENKKIKIGVVGLGLIGGSILKALFKKGYDVTGVSKSSYVAAREFSTYSSPEIEDVKNCNVVFVCSKMNETLEVLDRLEGIVSKDCLVLDVCSLKRFVNNKKRPYNFISSHPMAGTEFSGFKASFAELFCGAKWILTRENTILENLIKEMGAIPLIMDENTHDKHACLISHLPMLLSSALMKTVAQEDIEALKIASSGFRDTTRLSLTNFDLAYDMLKLNSDNFDIMIEKFIENLRKMKNMDREELFQTFESIQKIRSSLYDENGKNKL